MGSGMKHQVNPSPWLQGTRVKDAKGDERRSTAYLDQLVAVPYTSGEERTPSLHSDNGWVVAFPCTLREDETDVARRVFRRGGSRKLVRIARHGERCLGRARYRKIQVPLRYLARVDRVVENLFTGGDLRGRAEELRRGCRRRGHRSGVTESLCDTRMNGTRKLSMYLCFFVCLCACDGNKQEE
jgi:hypothetical protein